MEEIKREVLLEQGVNLEDAMHRFLDMDELYEKFLLKYADDQGVSKMQEAIKKCDAEATFKAAHAMKGLAGNLGMDRIYAMSSEITELTRGKSNEEVDFELLGNKAELLAAADNELSEVIRRNFG